MQVVAVPVKRLDRSKSRLAGVLSPAERAALTLAMLADVLEACRGVPGWELWVVSPDPAALDAAARQGGRPILEERGSLLAAVRQVEAEAKWGELAVVLGDLPYLTSDDLRAALATGGAVVAAPAASDGGTNLLLRRPSTAIPARFGTASFQRHRWEARRRGLDFRLLRLPGLERDLDRPEDLARLIASAGPGHARSACLNMGLAERLPLLERLPGG